jgi:hypothetical protein
MASWLTESMLIIQEKFTCVGEKIQTINWSRPSCQTAQSVGSLNKQNFHFIIVSTHGSHRTKRKKKKSKLAQKILKTYGYCRERVSPDKRLK